MRLILAVVVGLTSVAADGVCEDTGLCNINLNKQQCCSLNLPIVKTCAANCCERLGPEGTEDPGFLAGCPNFVNVAGCECAAAEATDGPTAEPTPAPTPCRSCTTKEDCDEFEICNVPSARRRRGLRFGRIPEGCCRGAR